MSERAAFEHIDAAMADLARAETAARASLREAADAMRSAAANLLLAAAAIDSRGEVPRG